MKRFLVFFFFIFFIPTLLSGGNLYEEQLDKGLENSDAYSYFLIEKSRADPAKTKEMLLAALRYSPELPAVYFELSKVSFSFSTEGIFQAFAYMTRGVEAYTKNFWWSFMAAGSLFMSFIISFVISVIIIVLVRLFKDLSLLSHDIMEQKTRVFLLLILISALTGPLLFVGGLLIILGLYMKTRDKAVVYLYLVFLLFLPLVLKTSSMFLSLPSSDVLKAVVLVNESKDNRYALSVLENAKDDVALFSYALALKREGGYDKAITIYSNLISEKPDPKVYNNLANCYFAKNDTEMAKQLYEKAVQMKSLVSAYYNLSQVSRVTLDLEKGEEYFLSAQRLDSNAVSRFQAIFGHNPNRFVIDEVLSIPDIWRYALGTTIKVSHLGLSAIPLSFSSFISIFFGILFYILDSRMKQRAYKCQKCGTVLCTKCEKKILWGHMCPQCYKTLVNLHELDARERITRLQTVYEHQKRRRRIMNILSFLIPGFSQTYAGDILRGLLFLWSFLFFLFVFVVSSMFIAGVPYSSHTWLNWGSIALLVIVYFVSNIMTRRRLAKGWL
jgi:tetratricopeptide (TPR) repeat protein